VNHNHFTEAKFLDRANFAKNYSMFCNLFKFLILNKELKKNEIKK
jgi:hypothetical protein